MPPPPRRGKVTEQHTELLRRGKSHARHPRDIELTFSPPPQNFISPTTIRDITSLRQDFFSSLSELGFVPHTATPSDPSLNAHSQHQNLLKAVILGALWPQVARAVLPRAAIKFDRVQAGTVQRENTAREFRLYDVRAGERVFVHPASVLFSEAAWRAPFAAYFQKQATSKVFLRDATEVGRLVHCMRPDGDGVLIVRGRTRCRYMRCSFSEGRSLSIISAAALQSGREMRSSSSKHGLALACS